MTLVRTRLARGIGVDKAARSRDPRYPCMACRRKPSDYVTDEVAPDGGPTYVCRQCYGRSRKRWDIIGTVGWG